MASRIEENLRLSFSYVKKDLMRVNDQISDLKEQIQHLSLNQATLLAEIERLRRSKKVSKKVKAKPKKKVKRTAKKTRPVKKKVVKETVTYS
jgi:prefoldin subunit 5